MQQKRESDYQTPFFIKNRLKATLNRLTELSPEDYILKTLPLRKLLQF